MIETALICVTVVFSVTAGCMSWLRATALRQSAAAEATRASARRSEDISRCMAGISDVLAYADKLQVRIAVVEGKTTEAKAYADKLQERLAVVEGKTADSSLSKRVDELAQLVENLRYNANEAAQRAAEAKEAQDKAINDLAKKWIDQLADMQLQVTAKTVEDHKMPPFGRRGLRL